jgi:hypothetical protein
VDDVAVTDDGHVLDVRLDRQALDRGQQRHLDIFAPQRQTLGRAERGDHAQRVADLRVGELHDTGDTGDSGFQRGGPLGLVLGDVHQAGLRLIAGAERDGPGRADGGGEHRQIVGRLDADG